MAAIFGLIELEVVSFDRSTDPENPAIESNMKWIGWFGSPVAEIWPFGIRHYHEGCIWDHHFGEGEAVGSHWSYHSTERCWFPIYAVHPSLPLRYLWLFGHKLPLSACDAQINMGWVTGSEFWGVPFGVDRDFWGLQRANKRPRLTNREIIFEEFQPMWSFTIPQRHGQTDDLPYQ